MAYTNIDDPSAFFQAKTWTGDGATSTRTITNGANSELAPDMIFGACRSNVQHKWIQDSSRGFSTGNKELVTNNTQVEGDTNAVNSGAYGWLGPSVTDGFKTSKGSVNSGYWNVNARTYVAWQWKANGGTTVSNTDGDITTTVQANQDAGFSIVTYTGNGTNNTKIGHGLGVTLDMMMVKNRDTATNWQVFHKDLDAASPEDYRLKLNLTDAVEFASNIWGTTTRTSTTIAVKAFTDTNASGNNYVAYCFASKQGYSKFGKYTGNASANGTFVYTGFKPAWVMVKRFDGTSDWTILDSKRPGYNLINKRLVANSTAGEATYNVLDFVSNGFKFRDGDGIWNGSGSNYIYMAFAENPFTTSTGIPTTAR